MFVLFTEFAKRESHQCVSGGRFECCGYYGNRSRVDIQYSPYRARERLAFDKTVAIQMMSGKPLIVVSLMS
jgi:hypothetical protein